MNDAVPACADDREEVLLLVSEARQLQAILVEPSTRGPRSAICKQHVEDIRRYHAGCMCEKKNLLLALVDFFGSEAFFGK